MKRYVTLGISIFSEVFAITMLKMSESFTIFFPSIEVIIGYGLSFYCFSICLRIIPLGLAYAIWSGVGTALTTMIGVLVWGDLFNILTLSGIVLIIGRVVLLNSANYPKPPKPNIDLKLSTKNAFHGGYLYLPKHHVSEFFTLPINVTIERSRHIYFNFSPFALSDYWLKLQLFMLYQSKKDS